MARYSAFLIDSKEKSNEFLSLVILLAVLKTIFTNVSMSASQTKVS